MVSHLANVMQSRARLVQQNFLEDESGDCFAEFRARFHDTEAQGNDFRG